MRFPTRLMLPLLVAAVSMSALGCGGDAAPEKKGGRSSGPPKPARLPDVPADLDAIHAFVAEAPADPEGLSKWAGVYMSRTYIETAAAVEGRPAPADLRPKLEAIYDRYGHLFIAIGRRREEMSEADRAVFDDAMKLEFIRTATRTKSAQDRLRSVNKHYSDTDKELWRVLTFIPVANSFWRLEAVHQMRGAAERFGVAPDEGK